MKIRGAQCVHILVHASPDFKMMKDVMKYLLFKLKYMQ